VSDANSRQVGGDHYKGTDYQHWDYASDLRLHYLAGTASKYIGRNRRKNGNEDIEKGIHYIDKAEERNVTGSIQTDRMVNFWRYVISNKLTLEEAMVTYYIQEAEWEAARISATMLLPTDVE
jgi:hypothetical protein